jgi:acetyl esterase/lipase
MCPTRVPAPTGWCRRPTRPTPPTSPGSPPALVITPEFDRLHAEGQRYAQRLRKAGALVEHCDVPQADHGYDINDVEKARQTSALIARRVKQATQPSTPAPLSPQSQIGERSTAWPRAGR